MSYYLLIELLCWNQYKQGLKSAFEIVCTCYNTIYLSLLYCSGNHFNIRLAGNANSLGKIKKYTASEERENPDPRRSREKEGQEKIEKFCDKTTTESAPLSMVTN